MSLCLHPTQSTFLRTHSTRPCFIFCALFLYLFLPIPWQSSQHCCLNICIQLIQFLPLFLDPLNLFPFLRPIHLIPFLKPIQLVPFFWIHSTRLLFLDSFNLFPFLSTIQLVPFSPLLFLLFPWKLCSRAAPPQIAVLMFAWATSAFPLIRPRARLNKEIIWGVRPLSSIIPPLKIP